MNGHGIAITADRHGSKAIRVARHLAAAIQSGACVPGQRLVEAELTTSLGISRSVLREAFRILSAEGSIEIVPNRGALVRRLSRREALELFQIRMELESLAARLAAANIGQPGVRAAFAAATAAINEDRPRTSTSDYLHETAAFHAATFEAAGNRELARLNRQLHLSLIMSQISPMLTPDVIRASLNEHRAIAAAILAADADAAATAARAHLTRARDFVRATASDVFRLEPPDRPDPPPAGGDGSGH